jgi:hypothetical protein
MIDLIESENFFTEEELEFVDNEILSENIPWYYNKHSTSKKFPFFSHTIIPRRETIEEEMRIISPLHDFFKQIQIRFCETHNIKITTFYRQCINLTFPNDNFEYGDAHVDHGYEHKMLLIYLNDNYEKGETLIFNKKNNYEEKLPLSFCLEKDKYFYENISIIKEINPKKGKVVCFNGNNYHTMRWIPQGRRIIYVSSFN